MSEHTQRTPHEATTKANAGCRRRAGRTLRRFIRTFSSENPCSSTGHAAPFEFRPHANGLAGPHLGQHGRVLPQDGLVVVALQRCERCVHHDLSLGRQCKVDFALRARTQWGEPRHDAECSERCGPWRGGGQRAGGWRVAWTGSVTRAPSGSAPPARPARGHVVAHTRAGGHCCCCAPPAPASGR
jgi:hypothetical protein